MKRILIRCDASLSMGSGHVARCSTLAHYLSSNGAEVIFVCRAHPGNLINNLSLTYPVVTLPEVPDQNSVDQFRISPNLPSTFGSRPIELQDARQTFDALSQKRLFPFDWIVVDHYSLSVIWEQSIKNIFKVSHQIPPKILVIDDLADRCHAADLLLDQNYFGDQTSQRYKDLIPISCKTFLGPQYFLLSQEYLDYISCVSPRLLLRRIILFFGGTDLNGYTLKILSFLLNNTGDEFEIDVVIGPQNQEKESLQKCCSKYSNVHVHLSQPSLAKLFFEADLAIGAGGITTYERMALGLPCISISVAINQSLPLQSLDSQGSLLLSDPASIYQDIISVIQDFSSFAKSCFHSSQNLMKDVCGYQQLIEELLK